MIKLNLGSSSHEIKGFAAVDRMYGREVYPLDYADGSVDEIRASHILEHFGHRETLGVLKEWVRVLKPGGLIRIAVPDFRFIAEQYIAGENLPFMGYIYGGHVDENDKHGAAFDEEELTQLMQKCGLVDIQRWESEIEDCASLPVSLNLQGIKADAPPEFDYSGISKQVRGCLSSSRLGFMDTMVSVMQALVPLGIMLEINTGVFWGQALTAMMQGHIDQPGLKYYLTLDFDTLFTMDDVKELYRLMEVHPEIDVLTSLQMRREGETPLLTVCSKSGQNMQTIASDAMDGEVMPINSAHFGLTMIRVESLRKMKKPWFHHVPDENGEYGPNHFDEDVWFWHQLKESGMTAYQANKVVIGHLQLMATWPNQNLTATHQYLKDWYETGKPKAAR